MTKNADFSLPVTRLGPFGTIIRVEGSVGTLPSRSTMNETGKTHSSKDFLRFLTDLAGFLAPLHSGGTLIPQAWRAHVQATINEEHSQTKPIAGARPGRFRRSPRFIVRQCAVACQTVHTVTRAELKIKNHPNSLHPRLFHYADGSALEHFSY